VVALLLCGFLVYSSFMDIVELEIEKPRSSEAIIELLRGLLDTAYDTKIEFIDISVKAHGKINSVSISDK